MDIVLFPQHWASLLCIAIIVGSLVIGYLKKLMMTYVLIISNILVFFISFIFQSEVVTGVNSFAGLGFRSVYLQSGYIPQIYTIFTSMFVHAGFLHIFGNMFIFFFIGTAFEERIGIKKFLMIYLLTGVFATLTHSVLNLNDWTPLVGASGAIFGIMGAFAFSYPRDEVVMPVPIGIMIITRIKVIYAVVIFAIMETAITWYNTMAGVQSSTAHFAHLGGLVSGFIIAAIVLKSRKTHTKSGKTIYYDSFAPQRTENLNISNLKKLAETEELKEMLKKIEKETVPQVREIWVEHFLEKAICPKCSNSINHFDGKIWCEHCGFRSNY
jgi:membrane associated rhomboid family serine protease